MPSGECAPPKAAVYHFVAIWLKNPADQAALERIMEQAEAWRDYPGVLSVDWGNAVPSDRPVVQDYDLGVLMVFVNEEALRAYEQDPEHQKAIREILAPAAEKVEVFDFLTSASHSNGVDRAELRKRQLRHYQVFAQ